MLSNHFKIAVRLFIKYKVYSGINLLGLSLAFMICFFCFLYIQDELSYDKFHTDAEKVFLIAKVNYKEDVKEIESSILNWKPLEGISKSVANNLPFLEQAGSTIPEIENLVRIQAGYITLESEGEEFKELAQYIDQDFFSVVDFPFIDGKVEDVMSDLKSAVVSEKFAMKYFGSVDVVGKELVLKGNDGPFLISGVISTASNSVIDRDVFLRIENSQFLEDEYYNGWGFNAFIAFVKLNDSRDKAIVQEKLRDIEADHDGASGLSKLRERLNLAEDNPVYTYQLKPIADIYLDPTIVFGDSSSFLYSLILAGISLIILIIACINYLAISITASAGRRSEVAIRKVIGANILHLKGQFYAESFLQVSIAVLLGFTLTQALLPSFNDLAEKEFTLTLFENLRLLFGGLLFGVALTFFAGGYPAQILSRFKALAGLKGNGSHKISSKLIKGMVVFQFTLCLMFISVGLAMREQFEFINNKDLGFDEEQVVYVEGVSGKTNLLKEELAKYPSVIMASGSSGIFVGRIIHGVDPINGVENRISFISIDSDFFQTLGVDLVDVEGVQSVEKEQMASGMSFLNESYLNALKADSLMYAESIASIDGVVVDFHFESLQNEIASQKFEITEPGRLSTLFVKLRPNQIEEGLSAIRESYAKITEKPLEEVKFLDEFLNSRYEDSRKWQRIVNISASIGLLIACIGLFGLTGMGMANQMKELSIRKVLGANARDLAYALNRQSFILIIVASVISIPVSYYLIKRWLNDFAYHVDITAQVFAVSILLLVLITLITVTYHSIKVIFTNPVNILRNE
ncbi:hypothetical protein AWW68_11785 [Roseivirga spongicola]|uniref:ABC3 transporter permease protein domain-containing protein n=2 Tax=Roseivirga TaxID=290180 RepID=A0A150X3S7_9BACT|nr:MULTISPECIES: FtsX-like permease family protein [Roseivirga]KYG73380.1 hypothetical protein AWW68_11785 [Roseivirga spongicola]MBO6659628.1 ABC transporter permease [Roseivirga sp.]MBO6759510.1 ABC transporter permease [Roseivirga sp.]MBO6907635.1 ABC transporter permease [Roseivirga sp.]